MDTNLRVVSMGEGEAHNRMGRPTLYQEKYNKTVKRLALLGATDKEIADAFDVNTDTINQWKLDYPNFSVSIKEGRILADSKIAESLYHRAKGYKVTEMKVLVVNDEVIHVPVVKEYPPDTRAAALWLNNRQRDKWRIAPAEVAPQMTDAEETARRFAMLLDAASKGVSIANNYNAPNSEETK